MEEEFTKPALDKFRQWHFWWLVVFSFLLIITFVYYFPTRFLQQSGTPHNEEMPVDEGQPHGHDSSGNSIPPAGHDSGGMMMTDEEMHAHMDEHMGAGMDMDSMMDHMMEMHDMTQAEAEQMMSEMMGHEHEGETGHDHDGATTGEPAAQGSLIYQEESNVKDGLAVNLNISPVPYNTGVPLSLDFFVNQKRSVAPNQTGTPVLASQLQLEHTKLMHVIGLRSDMNEFFHIHPDFLADNPSIFSIDHTFEKPGLYKIWSSVRKDGVDYVFGHTEANINGAGTREDKKVTFTRNVATGNYQVSMVASDTVVKNQAVDLSFDIHSLTGQEITVEDFIGAQMHLVIIKDDLKQFIHTHPAGHEHSYDNNLIKTALADEGHEHSTTGTSGQASGDEVISFTATFPEAGLYKAFAQFRPKGINLPADEALTAEFWIQVEEKAALPISQWWGLLLVSAILIAGLSWAVNNYLKVKPEDVTVKK